MEFTCKQSTIGEILQNDHFYAIPKYQRNYVWSNMKILDLWKDIEFNINEGGSIKYFLGCFIFRTGEVYEIIDGQQRLTSILVLLSIICRYFRDFKDTFEVDKTKKYCVLANKDTRSLTPRVDRNSDLLLNAIVDYCIFSDAKITFTAYLEARGIPYSSDNQLISAYNIYFEYIQTKLEGISNIKKKIEYLDCVLDTITKTSTITMLVENTKTACLAFETINARGQVLEVSDLIKNYLFMYEKPIAGKSSFEDNWKAVTSIIERCGDPSLPRFFACYCTSFFGKRKKNELFDTFKMNTGRDQVGNRMKSIHAAAVIYSHIVSGTDGEKTHQEMNYYLSSLNNMGISILRPLLLSVLFAFSKYEIDYKTLCDRLKKVVSFFAIFVYICGNKTNAIEQTIYDYAHELNINFSIVKLDKFISILLERKPDRVSFEQSFIRCAFTKHKERYNGIIMNKKKVQHILGVFELYLRNDGNYITPVFSLEHIKDDSLGGNACYIGNFVILPERKNNKLSGKTMETKQKVYADSSYMLTQKFSRHSNILTWDDENIDKRSKSMAAEFYDKIWTCS